MKKLSELNLGTITLIQVLVATIISILFQFVFPLTWQPLDRLMHGDDIQHGVGEMHYIIFTITQWYFSFSIAWFLYRKNPWINNFLIYSITPIFVTVYLGFSLGLYHDYIHLTVFLVDILILSKKEIRDTLEQKYILFILPLSLFWVYTVYILRLAYYGEPFASFMMRMLLMTIVASLQSFVFRKKKNIDLVEE